MTIRRSMLTVIAAVGAALVPVSAATAAPTVTDPVYSYANAVRETVWVDTGLTSPQGARVRVAADIIRPSTPAGVKVPVIMDASPYYTTLGRGNESQKKTYDSAGKPVQFPLFYDNSDLTALTSHYGVCDLAGPSSGRVGGRGRGGRVGRTGAGFEDLV
ncbi:CocE/NonD family hydrolase [Actinokineospora sp. HUAS TT18]|uniref:CocE/NonD family hydrolase n=1 Tax=Actinokineospora sp. HUAS TT18 TaxID=3447451 RepID=UPI003F51F051